MKAGAYFFNLKNILSVIFLLWINVLMAQTKNTSTNNQQWLQYYNQIKLNEKWTWVNDGGYRWRGGFEESAQYILRTGIGYSINPNVRILTGFAHLGFFSDHAMNKVEFRPYQELVVKNRFNKIGITHRYRIEERFFNPIVDRSIESPNTFNFRFRYSFMASFPLFGLSKTDPDKLFVLNIGDEIFINAGSSIVNNVFDQNRILISPSFLFSKNLTIALTWNSQFASTTQQASYRYSNIIWFQIKHNLDLNAKSI